MSEELGWDITVAGTPALRAMTLLELLVAVSLLMVIILGLYGMFSKTQAVLRSGVTSVEVQESGRIALDMIRRELEQLTLVGTSLTPNPSATNLAVSEYFSTNNSAALVMALGGGQTQSNLLQDVFFLVFDPNRDATPNNWSARGYRVANPADPRYPAANGVGTLYRFVTNVNRFAPTYHTNYVSYLTDTNHFQRVAENVVHLSLRAFTNGVPVPADTYAFADTNAPTLLELELGFIETAAVDQARARATLPLQRAFLESQANRVHYFKTLIPVRVSHQ